MKTFGFVCVRRQVWKIITSFIIYMCTDVGVEVCGTDQATTMIGHSVNYELWSQLKTTTNDWSPINLEMVISNSSEDAMTTLSPAKISLLNFSYNSFFIHPEGTAQTANTGHHRYYPGMPAIIGNILNTSDFAAMAWRKHWVRDRVCFSFCWSILHCAFSLPLHPTLCLFCVVFGGHWSYIV